ncbi:MAG: type IV pilus biogenesis/stability protein PilW [Proteobacteria bacterium]|nr:type IV pilus biogenesis/stability protein PilW [Pseudomonadota bacterium]
MKATVLAAVCLLSLSACVTSTETVFTEEASPEKTLERRLSLARQYIGNGNWEDAKRNLQLAVEIDPNSAEVHEAFALVYQSTGEYELAEESYKAAIKLRSHFSRARNNYAAFLFSQERYQEAEIQLEYVVKDTLYSSRPQAFINLGLCRLKLFNPQGAEEAFVRSLAMNPKNTIPLLEVAQLRFDADDVNSANRYYQSYRQNIRQQSPRALWLGIRIAQQLGDRNAEGSYVLALSSLHPDSLEYQAYLRAMNGDG